MRRDKKHSTRGKVPDVDIFRPPPNPRNPLLQEGEKPDSRLVSLVKILARQAAKEHFEAECDAENEIKDQV